MAVNPNDARYQDLAGQTVTLPLMNRPIPIIFDEIADRQFGTGVVKITPAHDPNDLEASKRIVADLEKQGLLEKVEPYPLALTNAIDAASVNEGRIQFVPDDWDKTFFNCMENIRDWCISRQLWWRVRRPPLATTASRPNSPKIRTFSTPGSVPAFGRFQLSADPRTSTTRGRIIPPA